MEKTIAAERTLERPNCGADNTDGMIHNLHRETVDPMAPYLPPYQMCIRDSTFVEQIEEKQAEHKDKIGESVEIVMEFFWPVHNLSLIHI